MWNRRITRAAIGLLAGVTCAAPVAVSAATVQEILTYRGADRQAMLEAGAKKEGSLNLYSALTINQALRPLAEGFRKKYPYLKVEFWRAESRKIAQKSLAEIRAKTMVGDVLEGSGLAEIMVKAKAIEKFHTPAIDAIAPEYRDKESQWVPSRFSYFGVAYNTRLIPPGSQPKTYEDLLDPKWKGKIAWRAESESGALLMVTTLRLSMGDAKADAYFRKLKDQGIIGFTGSARTLVNRVIEGEYPIAVNIFMHHATISAQKGAPVAPQSLEPVPSINGTMMIPKGVARPHAAMLFVDYYLSKEGQEVLKKARYFPVRGDVKPRKELEPLVPKVTGVKEMFISPEVLFDNRKTSEALYRKYFR
jgi:iron(III) transport system substrate-binding protein